MDLEQTVATVQKNCHISDAQFAGDYTLCIFLLKMREFYRWENRLPYGGALPRDEVGRWMQARERLWEELESSPFEPLVIDDRSFDPFDTAGINRALLPRGYVYSAGYGRFSKPHFFLATLRDSSERDGVRIHVAAREYARDIVAPPAMLLDGVIYLRQESLRRYLWERVEEWRWNRGSDSMARAVEHYDFDADVEAALDRMTDVETESVILHELGEARAEQLLGERWAAMLAELSRSRVEIMVRAVRDLLADCLSTLPGLLRRGEPAALHFFFANLTGMRRHLFPEALDSYRRWTEGDPRALPQLAEAGAARWLDVAREILDLHARFGAEAVAPIEQRLDRPPGCKVFVPQTVNLS